MSEKSNQPLNSVKNNKQADFRIDNRLIMFIMALLVAVGGYQIVRSQATPINPLPSSSPEANNAGQDVSNAELANSVIEPTPIKTNMGVIPVLQDTALSLQLNPYTYEPKLPVQEFITYTVKRGETPNVIAARFGIQPETLLGGNPSLSEESNLLQRDFDLVILPIDGVLHDVRPGDTLEKLAAEFFVSVEDIIAYEPNNLEFPYRLVPETQILIPGAVRELFVWTPPTLADVTGGSREGSGVRPIIVGTGTFVWPIVSRAFTQYFWYGHPGIDVASATGSAVVASDTGTVTFAGWNIYGYGNLIVVNHGNGYETFYAHLSGINVVPGQIVYQGNVIGAVGNTGNSSGPHIHFEVRWNANQDNPCSYIFC